nr:PREDICTED: sperm acrosome membrane-associated protein 4 [Lepisosteus oculatus]
MVKLGQSECWTPQCPGLPSSVLLCLGVLLPTVPCAILLCHFCPVHRLDVACVAMETECQPEELCYTGTGHRSGLEPLSAQGCLPRVLCGLQHPVSYRGSNYTMSSTCCSWDLCNRNQSQTPGLEQLLRMPYP